MEEITHLHHATFEENADLIKKYGIIKYNADDPNYDKGIIGPDAPLVFFFACFKYRGRDITISRYPRKPSEEKGKWYTIQYINQNSGIIDIAYSGKIILYPESYSNTVDHRFNTTNELSEIRKYLTHTVYEEFQGTLEFKTNKDSKSSHKIKIKTTKKVLEVGRRAKDEVNQNSCYLLTTIEALDERIEDFDIGFNEEEFTKVEDIPKIKGACKLKESKLTIKSVFGQLIVIKIIHRVESPLSPNKQNIHRVESPLSANKQNIHFDESPSPYKPKVHCEESQLSPNKINEDLYSLMFGLNINNE